MVEKILALDVDDTVADLVTVWLDKYNKEYDDAVTKNQITDWDIASFTKKIEPEKFYDYVRDPKIYDDVMPIDGALEFVEYVNSYNKVRIIFITVVDYGKAKLNWLKRYGFIKDDKDFVITKDKSLVRYDFLIDDKYQNLNKSNGVLYTQAWNIKYQDVGRINNWIEFLQKLKAEENNEKNNSN